MSLLHHMSTSHPIPGHRYLIPLSFAANSGATTLNPSATHTPNALPKRLNKDQTSSKYASNQNVLLGNEGCEMLNPIFHSGTPITNA